MRDSIPEELLCNICGELIHDAIVLPCCAVSACQKCGEAALRESDVCPIEDCKTEGILPDELIPNRRLRQKASDLRERFSYKLPVPASSASLPVESLSIHTDENISCEIQTDPLKKDGARILKKKEPSTIVDVPSKEEVGVIHPLMKEIAKSVEEESRTGEPLSREMAEVKEPAISKETFCQESSMAIETVSEGLSNEDATIEDTPSIQTLKGQPESSDPVRENPIIAEKLKIDTTISDSESNCQISSAINNAFSSKNPLSDVDKTTFVIEKSAQVAKAVIPDEIPSENIIPTKEETFPTMHTTPVKPDISPHDKTYLKIRESSTDKEVSSSKNSDDALISASPISLARKPSLPKDLSPIKDLTTKYKDHTVIIPSEYVNVAKEDPLAVFQKLMEAKDKEKGITDSATYYGTIPNSYQTYGASNHYGYPIYQQHALYSPSSQYYRDPYAYGGGPSSQYANRYGPPRHNYPRRDYHRGSKRRYEGSAKRYDRSSSSRYRKVEDPYYEEWKRTQDRYHNNERWSEGRKSSRRSRSRSHSSLEKDGNDRKPKKSKKRRRSDHEENRSRRRSDMRRRSRSLSKKRGTDTENDTKHRKEEKASRKSKYSSSDEEISSLSSVSISTLSSSLSSSSSSSSEENDLSSNESSENSTKKSNKGAKKNKKKVKKSKKNKKKKKDIVLDQILEEHNKDVNTLVDKKKKKSKRN